MSRFHLKEAPAFIGFLYYSLASWLRNAFMKTLSEHVLTTCLNFSMFIMCCELKNSIKVQLLMQTSDCITK